MKLHEDIIEKIKINDINPGVSFFCRTREIAAVFVDYIYKEYGINFFQDVDDCMCYNINYENSFFVTEDYHRNCNLINVYLD